MTISDLERLLNRYGNNPLNKNDWQDFLPPARNLDEHSTTQGLDQWLESMLTPTTVFIFLMDRHGSIYYFNEPNQTDMQQAASVGSSQKLNYAQDIIGLPLRNLLSSSLEGMRIHNLIHEVSQASSADVPVIRETQVLFKDAAGNSRALQCQLAPVISRSGQVEGVLLRHEAVDFYIFKEEISQGLSMGHKEQQAFFHSLLDSIPAPLVVLDANQRYVYCNPVAIKNPEIRAWIIGKTDGEYVAYRGFDPDLATRRNEHFRRAIREKRPAYLEEMFVTPSGNAVHQWRSYSPVYAADGSLSFCVGYGLDITDHKQTQHALERMNTELTERVMTRTLQLAQINRQLEHDALHDGLTGLPNRALFVDRLEQAIARCQANPELSYMVLYLDTDRFKGVNDTLGHPVGDALLVQLSQRLNGLLKLTETLARVGGDEFALLLDSFRSPAQAIQLAEHIQKVVKQPFLLQGMEVAVTVSIGIVKCDASYKSSVDVLKDADISMYQAKEDGRATHKIFTKDMREKTIHRNLLENHLRQAIKRNELRVVYQPIIELKTNKLNGFEALVRWQHPERGLISPAEFIPLAEETGLLIDIDHWVLKEAGKQIKSWQVNYPSLADLTLSVNFSSRHFALPEMVESLEAILDYIQFPPEKLHIEITEGVLLQQPQALNDTLTRICNLGVKLHLDDFGTGYSSLSYLQFFPFHTLKIDRSFVRGMLQRADSAELVKTIIAMAKVLKLCVVAEGIEQQEQLDMLRELNCEYGQGYHISMPISAENALNFALYNRNSLVQN